MHPALKAAAKAAGMEPPQAFRFNSRNKTARAIQHATAQAMRDHGASKPRIAAWFKRDDHTTIWSLLCQDWHREHPAWMPAYKAASDALTGIDLSPPKPCPPGRKPRPPQPVAAAPKPVPVQPPKGSWRIIERDGRMYVQGDASIVQRLADPAIRKRL